MDFDEYEKLPTKNLKVHMTAGAIAGVLEHCIMYPFDSVKTRMQSLSPEVNYSNPIQGLVLVVRREGFKRLFRGMGAVVFGAAPAHAMYFSVYEHLKETLQQSTNISAYLAAGISGMMATIFHDGMMTPPDAVKQRMQMENSPYRSLRHCVAQMYRKEGIRAFYRSYSTQLSMNIPFQIIHFMTYEVCQNLTNKEKQYNPKAHVISGAIAGALAAALTTPLDVVKTLLNTQQHKVKGMLPGFNMVYRIGGIRGFWKGLYARVLFQVPSTAICWSVYEFFKFLLFSGKVVEIKWNNKLLIPTVLVSDHQISKLKPVLLLPEVNLEPIKSPEESQEFDNFVGAETKTSTYESKIWSNSIPQTLNEESIGNHKCDRKTRLKDKYERTIFDKSEWESTVIPGAEIFG